MTYPVLYKLEKLAKESGCAVVLMAYSDGAGSRHGEVWRNEFAEKISSVLCIERQGIENGEVSLNHEKCILAPEGKKRTFWMDGWETPAPVHGLRRKTG